MKRFLIGAGVALALQCAAVTGAARTGPGTVTLTATANGLEPAKVEFK